MELWLSRNSSVAFSSHLKWVGPLQVIDPGSCSKVCGHEEALLSLYKIIGDVLSLYGNF